MVYLERDNMVYDAMQDGADFYLTQGDELVAVISYPKRVGDFDLEEAQKARSWFEELARKWNFTASF
jgi:hypothetical protein